MSARQALEEIVADFDVRSLPDPTPRRCRLPAVPGKVDVVVGMRRSGKTWFLYRRIVDLAAGGVGEDRLLHVSFEDERLLPLSAGDLGAIPEAHYRRYPAARDEECWFFFDEIQNVPGWEVFVRRLVDARGVRLVLTGSSARLMSREIATSMRGRSLTSELLPFGFDEALVHAGVALPQRWPPSAHERSLLQHHFERYLEVGGFPEVQGLAAETRVRVLQDYVDVVLLRDIVERHEVRNVTALRYLLRRLVGTPAGRFSVNRIYNDLRSQGIPVGKDTLHEYLAHLEDAFLVLTVPIYTQSERVRMVNPRKAYLVDHGLARAVSFKASEDRGHLLENVVYLELRRRGWALAYVTTVSGWEVDFLALRPTGSSLLVQVCSSLSEPRTRERELRALAEALEEHDVPAALVVTHGETETLEVAGREVRVVPAWRWLLEPSRSAP